MPDHAPPSAAEAQETAIARSGLPFDRVGLFLGPLLLLGWLLFTDPGPLSPQAHRLAGILMLTFVWWVAEPIPLAATGLLAVSLCVVLGAVPTDASGAKGAARAALAPFGDPAVFFLLGGSFIGVAMTRHGLDRRLALSLLRSRWAGRSPGGVLAAVGLGVMGVSMWVSNTAATAMMCPITLGLIAVLGAHDPRFARSPFASALLLMTAFASSVGGISTPIGTATNVVAIGFFRQPEYLGRSVDFLRWTFVGVPMMLAIFLGLYAWLRVRGPAAGLDMGALRGYLEAEHRQLGPWKRGEVNTLVVFLVVVGLWVTPGVLAVAGADATQREFLRHFPEEIVALLAPVLLFLIPASPRRGTLQGEDLQKIDWGTLLLFGSGLSLGGLMFKTGLAGAVGNGVFEALGTRDVWVVTAVAVAGAIVLSQFTSNAAAASALIPVVNGLCVQAGIDAVPPLLAVTFGASFGSTLPVSTPPNAIVYGTGLVPVRRMVVAGTVLDLWCGVVIWFTLRIAYGMLGWSPMEGG